MMLTLYLYIDFNIVHPVQFPDVKSKDLLVLIIHLIPELVHVAVCPGPAVGGEGLQRLGRLLHQGGHLDKERLFAHQLVQQVNKMGWPIVKQKLQWNSKIYKSFPKLSDLIMLYLEESIDIIVFLVRSSWIPEHTLIRISHKNRQPLRLYLAPLEVVDRSTGAVVHWDAGRPLIGGHGAHPPGHDTHQVDADIHWDHVCCTISPSTREDSYAKTTFYYFNRYLLDVCSPQNAFAGPC